MSARAGIVVTGTEVLSGIISDRNGPWLSVRLAEAGVDLAHIVIVGDRPADVEGALRFLAGEGMDVIITSGGLGPTADDLTAEVVGAFQGREMVLDEPLRGRIATILERLTARWPELDRDAIEAGNRKQAMIPEGAAILEPVGTAPGLVVPPAEGRSGPVVVVLPGPPRELQPMWATALGTPELQAALAGATEYERRFVRMFGIPESELAETLRRMEADDLPLDGLEITTCLRRGEIEVATRYEPRYAGRYDGFVAGLRERHESVIFGETAATIDELVAGLLRDGVDGAGAVTIATAESCTGGLLAARLTERPGSSAYVLGGLVTYANDAKVGLAGVDAGLIAAHGAVSAEVAGALAAGALSAFGSDLGVGITGVAGPDGGTEEKPVGRVHVEVRHRDGRSLARQLDLPGSRPDIRDRSTTVALHLVRRLLLGLGSI